jgi:cytochrome P450
MSDEELRIHLLTLLIGGHETTATSLCWAVHCLTGAPSGPGRPQLAQLREELSAAGDLDPGRVRELTYLGAAVQESMRLYPIATGVSRRLKRDMTLGGWALRAGTVVTPSIYLTQRHPSLWEQPNAFRPERFLQASKVPSFQSFPFGGGVWRCLGAAFADYEMRVVLARLFGRVELEPATDRPVKAELRGFTVAPAGGLPTRVVARR